MSVDDKIRILDALSDGGWGIGTLIIEMNGNIYNGKSEGEKHSYTDKQVATALSRIVGKDKPIDCKWKWAGAYWYLRWACEYPVDAKLFCIKIDGLKLDVDEKYWCDYRNIREYTTLSFMDQDATKMSQVEWSKNDDKEFSILREIALKLAEELEKTHLPLL